MKTLRKRIWRGIRLHFARNLAMFLLLVLMISATSGFYVVSESTKIKNYELMKAGRVEDGQILSAFPLPSKNVEAIQALGVETEAEYYVDVKIKKQKTLRIYKTRENINKPVITDGRLPIDNREVILNKIYAENNRIKIGEKIKVPENYFEGGEENFTVVGYFAAPDYNAAFLKNTDFMMDNISFGIAMVNEGAFSQLSDSNIKYKISYRFEDRNLSEAEREKLDKQIFKIANEYRTVENFIIKKNNNGINFMMNDMAGDRPMLTIMSSIMIVLIAFIFAVLASGTIREESEAIGTLLANGYRKKEIVAFYLATPIIITLAAAVVGNVLGYTVYITPYKNMYYKSFGLPNFEPVFSAQAFLITTILPFIIMLVINFVNLSRKLRFKPLDFLRRNLINYKRKNNIELKYGSFSGRFRTRIFLRNKGDYAVMVIGVFITTLLMFYGSALTPTIDAFEERAKHGSEAEYQYVLKGPAPLTDADEKAERFTFGAAEVYVDMRSEYEELSVFGLQDDAEYFPGIKLPEKPGEIVVSENVAKKTLLDVGDTIKIKDKVSNKVHKYKICGTYDYPALMSAFTKQEYLNKDFKFGEGYFNGYFSDEKLNVDEKMVAMIIDKYTMMRAGEQIKAVMADMVNMITIVSAIFFFVVVFMLSKIFMDKNSLSIAYLKIFGYNSGEIRRVYLRANTITLIVSLLVGIPLQIKLLKWLTYLAFLKFSGYFELKITVKTVVMVLILVFAIYSVVTMIQMRRISRMSFAQALKNRE